MALMPKPFPTVSEPLDYACMLVGRYQYNFAQLEAVLDFGISKLIGLNENAREIVCANIDFTKKIRIIDAAVRLQFKDESKPATDLLSRVAEINSDRLVVIHSTFSPLEDGGVSFLRVTADRELKKRTYDWNAAMFDSKSAVIKSVSKDLREVIEKLAPFETSLDFSDSRNSMYLFLM